MEDGKMNIETVIDIFKEVFDLFIIESPITRKADIYEVTEYFFTDDPMEILSDTMRIRVNLNTQTQLKFIGFALTVTNFTRDEEPIGSWEYDQFMSKSEHEIRRIFKTMSMNLKLSGEGYII